MTVVDGGPILVEGPVEVMTDDGKLVVSDRVVVALCTCRRSRIHPWCDTSHRRREHIPAAADTVRAPACGAGATSGRGVEGTDGRQDKEGAP
ncbi:MULTISPECIES: CDGSH iron-sulfur domain-containing protein [Streptomyces]|uniref:CDGSH iron-sulfur domain-containing protein n=1 Tax=unclassified Streptomyces TaxID=2593676 RepID=UPI00164DFA85|nr:MULTISPECIES: CDGSH iron-sulfur domain-containing protein [Streptomyces]